MQRQFDLCGDHLALDFANTLSARHTDAPQEWLTSYGELVSFARQTEVLSPARAAEQVALGEAAPQSAERALARAVALREDLYRLFAAVARGEPAPAAAIATLNGHMARLCIGPDLALEWRDQPGILDGFLGAVVRAAVELAIDARERSRVRLCEAPDCLWLFYDGSRNHSRRWCDMRQCGNRMKARRHYRRSRQKL